MHMDGCLIQRCSLKNEQLFVKKNHHLNRRKKDEAEQSIEKEAF